ncbi:MAG TPA: hypothetical protein VJ804_06560, partial [Acidimicrobiales bacterium]|nr:hypothetical protein [Acidimicrobiales bacterium]
MTDLIPTDETTAAPSEAPSRRRFLMTAGALGVGVVVAACSDDDEDTGTGATGGATDGTSGGGGGDAEIATFAAGLELLAANT